MTIESGSTKATVHKRLIGIRDHHIVDVDGGEDLKAHGNIVDHEYEIERDGCLRTQLGCRVPGAGCRPEDEDEGVRPGAQESPSQAQTAAVVRRARTSSALGTRPESRTLSSTTSAGVDMTP